jgi:hypothetical protein
MISSLSTWYIFAFVIIKQSITAVKSKTENDPANCFLFIFCKFNSVLSRAKVIIRIQIHKFRINNFESKASIEAFDVEYLEDG